MDRVPGEREPGDAGHRSRRRPVVVRALSGSGTVGRVAASAQASPVSQRLVRGRRRHCQERRHRLRRRRQREKLTESAQGAVDLLVRRQARVPLQKAGQCQAQGSERHLGHVGKRLALRGQDSSLQSSQQPHRKVNFHSQFASVIWA